MIDVCTAAAAGGIVQLIAWLKQQLERCLVSCHQSSWCLMRGNKLHLQSTMLLLQMYMPATVAAHALLQLPCRRLLLGQLY
jgi:hypothetical protein